MLFVAVLWGAAEEDTPEPPWGGALLRALAGWCPSPTLAVRPLFTFGVAGLMIRVIFSLSSEEQEA